MSELNHTPWFTGGMLPTQPDPRLDAYPLMNSYLPTALISLAYVIGVYLWRVEIVKSQKQSNGKNLIKPKSPQDESWNLVKCLMVFYNVAMVIYSAVVAFGVLFTAIKLGYGVMCHGSLDPNEPGTEPFVFFGYLFFFSKFVEMLDTVFFLWRGKVDQVTFLHVFHHASMPPSIWWGIRYSPGGILWSFPFVNSLIHVIMYTYYGLAAAGLYRYLWWKHYLTLAQMLQFMILIIHQGQVFVLSRPCNYPSIFSAAIILYATLFLFLFGNFYVKAYWRKQRLAKVSTQNGIHPSGRSKVATNGNAIQNGSAVPQKANGGSRRTAAATTTTTGKKMQ